jgi:ParB-like chromosome segregation protein Spo0J
MSGELGVTTTIKITIFPEYEKLVPALSKDDFDSLKESIEKHGQYIPIIINQDGIILDGHHRYKICQELGIELKYEIRKFENKLLEKKFVIETNLARRHLNDFQKSELGTELFKVEADLARERFEEHLPKEGEKDTRFKPLSLGSNEHHGEKGKARDIVAQKIGVSPTTYQRAKVIIERAPEEIKEKVRKGQKSITDAYNTIKKEEKRAKAKSDVETATRALKLPDRIILLNKDSTKVEELTEIPDNRVNLIITDPPYDRESLSLYDGLARLASEKLDEGGSVVFYFGLDLLPDIMKIFSEYTDLKFWWMLGVKLQSASKMRYHAKDVWVYWKPMMWFVKGEKKIEGPDIRDLIGSSAPDKNHHDWAQSQLEATYIIENLTLTKDSIVLDPFLGSGAFAIPAIKLGRYFYGIDIDKKVLDDADKYIKKETVK